VKKCPKGFKRVGRKCKKVKKAKAKKGINFRKPPFTG